MTKTASRTEFLTAPSPLNLITQPSVITLPKTLLLDFWRIIFRAHEGWLRPTWQRWPSKEHRDHRYPVGTPWRL
jgi:hypothetical protein